MVQHEGVNPIQAGLSQPNLHMNWLIQLGHKAGNPI